MVLKLSFIEKTTVIEGQRSLF